MELKIIESVLPEFHAEMLKVLNKHRHKGDSWKDCPISFLHDKLLEEFDEYLRARTISIRTSQLSAGYELQADELIDIANVAMMLWKRLKQMERD